MKIVKIFLITISFADYFTFFLLLIILKDESNHYAVLTFNYQYIGWLAEIVLPHVAGLVLEKMDKTYPLKKIMKADLKTL